MNLDSLDLATLSRRDGEKWSSAPAGALPAWVADMDFPVAPAVRRALLRRIDTDLGYPAWYDESGGGPLGEVFAARMSERFNFAADSTHVRLFTDVNQAMQVVLYLGTAPGAAVALHAPTCPPFLTALAQLGRPPRPVPLRRHGGRWDLDLDRVADEVGGRNGQPGCQVLFLVNPHNPTGRVCRRDELLALADLAVSHDLLVISDEVHAELTYETHRHIPFASLGDEVAARTVTITSASKTFNLAGLRCAVAHIGVKTIRDAVDAHRGILFGQVGALGVEAVRAAWTAGGPWLDSVREVLVRNRARLSQRLPEAIGYLPPEATYLAWLDCRALGLADPAGYFLDSGRVMLFCGKDFGPEGDGYVRLNFATSPQVLEEMLDRVCGAVDRLGRVGTMRMS
jgi:cystathionine beta-lyase